MCDPVTVLTVVLGVTSAISSKGVSDDRANIELENARIAEEAAATNTAIERKEAARLRARQRVAFLSSGVTFTGTPAEVLANTTRDQELDALAILQAGRIQAESHRASAAAHKRAGRGGLLGGLGKVASAFI